MLNMVHLLPGVKQAYTHMDYAETSFLAQNIQ